MTDTATHESWRERLETVQTLADLQSYATDLYASGELDESEQMTVSDPYYGWLAPWTAPRSAEVLEDTGEDITVRLSSGEVATWRNTDREWVADRVANPPAGRGG